MLAFVRAIDNLYRAKSPHEQKKSLAEAVLRMGF